MRKQRLRFFQARLFNASMAEIVYRLREQLLLRTLRYWPCALARPESPPQVNDHHVQALAFPRLEGEVNPDEVEAILNGRRYSLHEDVQSISDFEKRFQSTYFTNISLDQDDPDIRAVWEPGRLQHLTVLMHALQHGYESVTGKDLQAAVKADLLNWIEANPFLHGVHYLSVMECGLRIPVFVLALQALKTLSPQEREAILQILYEHGWIVHKRLSLYSSTGNHTVAECLGLVMAGGVFKGSKNGSKWLAAGIELLEQESCHQILNDGGPVEQSFAYHRFVLDCFWLAVGFLEGNSLHDCSRLKARLQRGELFLHAQQQAHGQLPQFGDSDDGCALAPGLAPERDLPDGGQEQNRVLTFAESGYSIFTSQDGVALTFDHGPLGMAPLYNHGHADALSVVVSRNGLPFLIDPGTYRYNGRPHERAYFKSTRAHNTVTVDGQDQAEQVTGFIWDHPYDVQWGRLVGPGGSSTITASHNGFERLEEPVTHSRSVTFEENGTIEIEDRFSGSGEHVFELNVHLHPEVRVHENSGGLWLVHGQERVHISFGGSSHELVSKRDEPMLGWSSFNYGIMQPTTVLLVRQGGHVEDVTFTTVITAGPHE